MASESSRPRSVLVVDDSPFIRRVVRDVLDDASDFVVIGEAANGYEAISQVHARSPDLLTLDVDMPSLDGLHTLGYVMSEAPRPVVMLSSAEDGGDTTMRALELGEFPTRNQCVSGCAHAGQVLSFAVAISAKS